MSYGSTRGRYHMVGELEALLTAIDKALDVHKEDAIARLLERGITLFPFRTDKQILEDIPWPTSST